MEGDDEDDKYGSRDNHEADEDGCDADDINGRGDVGNGDDESDSDGADNSLAPCCEDITDIDKTCFMK